MAEYDEGRREFLRTAVRWMILPAAVLGIGRLASRQGNACEADFICARCRLSTACKLPQAVSYRLDRRRGPNG